MRGRCLRAVQSVLEAEHDGYLQRVGLQAEAFGAELHDAVGAESVSDFVLTDGRQPEGRVHLQLRRWDQDGLVT